MDTRGKEEANAHHPSVLRRWHVHQPPGPQDDRGRRGAAGVPCDVIPMADYGMVNGKNVLAFAKKLIG